MAEGAHFGSSMTCALWEQHDALACVQIGAATPAAAATAAVLAEAMRAPAYSRLRTEQQLGYDVDVTACRHGGACGVALSVAGGAATAARARAALPAFLDAFGRGLAAMPKSEFNDLRDSAAMEMVRAASCYLDHHGMVLPDPGYSSHTLHTLHPLHCCLSKVWHGRSSAAQRACSVSVTFF